MKSSTLLPIEFRLLSELVANSGKVLTQRHLLLQVGGLIMWNIIITYASIWATYGKIGK